MSRSSKKGRLRRVTRKPKKRFSTKRNEGNLTTEIDKTDGFSFHASDKREEDSYFEVLTDSDCTIYLIKDIELISYLNSSQKRIVTCANGTESVIEGRRQIDFLPLKVEERYRKLFSKMLCISHSIEKILSQSKD